MIKKFYFISTSLNQEISHANEDSQNLQTSRGQTSREDFELPINSSIQQQQPLDDIETQNIERNNNEIEIHSHQTYQDLIAEEQRFVAQIHQIWLESFRQQIQQQGINSNVQIIQQNSRQKQSNGLSKEEIKKFQKVSYTQQEINQLPDSDIVCSICLEKYECDKKLIKLPCNHIYHNYCITKWLTQDNKCPLCRKLLQLSKQ